MKKLFANKYFKFGLAAFIYILFIIWLKNLWLIIGLPIIFDFYITKKVNWTFWKKRGVEKQTKAVEWIDALIFAVIAATIIRLFFIEAFTIPSSSMEKTLLVGDYLFVSKYSYGPKMPNTPISFPFAHNTLPWSNTTKSYVEWIKWPYKRLAGLGDVQRNDVVVFNFPEGDTVCLNQQSLSYYQLLRDYGYDAVHKNVVTDPTSGMSYNNFFGEIVSRPVDKRENYIKRCVGISGDTLQVIDGQVIINGKPQEKIGEKQFKYLIVTDGTPINPRVFENLEISKEDQAAAKRFDPAILNFMPQADIANVDKLFVYPLIEENAEKLKTLPNVKSVTRIVKPKNYRDYYIFPHNEDYKWNEDNFGPLYIPQKGTTIRLDTKNLPLYRRIIEVYEENKLDVKGEEIYINNQLATTYTFKMDYYFMMGDSRHNSADSRFWGFVPEDHVVGKALFIWMSSDKDKSFPASMRWNRIFKGIK